VPPMSCIPLPLLLAVALLSAQSLPPPTAADLRDGEKAYQFHCAFCHGRGDDGFAANLVSPRLPHAPSDSALLNVIRNGIFGSDMPAALGMSDTEIRQVAQYVRSLARIAPQKVAGDARRGSALYIGKGACNTCHMIGGQGGRQGPDLTDIGLRRSPANLRTSLVDPNAGITPGFVLTRVTTAAGLVISGIRLNENTFSIHIRDDQGRFHSLRKSTLKEIQKDPKSSMPSFQSLPAAELDDLVAYLFSLRGDQ